MRFISLAANVFEMKRIFYYGISNTNDVRGKRSFGSLTTGNNILHPYALFHQNEANNAFQNISDLHHGKYCQHMKPCKSAEAVRNGHTDPPHEHTVKQECNNGLA